VSRPGRARERNSSLGIARAAALVLAGTLLAGWAYLSRFRIDYASLNDPGDAIALDFRGTIPIVDFPSTLVFTRNGRLTGRIVGAVTFKGLTGLIKMAEAQ
jgi:hypothetical protein